MKKSDLISTHFRPMFPFYTPENDKTTCFLAFSGGIKMDHWPEMGLKQHILNHRYKSDRNCDHLKVKLNFLK